jgi:hypothetical protein
MVPAPIPPASKQWRRNFRRTLKPGNSGVYQHQSWKHLGRYLGKFDWGYNVRGLLDVQPLLSR